MDINIFLILPETESLELTEREAEVKFIFEDQGLRPKVYIFNKNILLEPHLLTEDAVSALEQEEDLSGWQCYILQGEFLRMVERDANGWSDEYDMDDSGLEEFIKYVFDTQEKFLLLLEKSPDELIDSVYTNKKADWVFEKIKSQMNRNNHFESFMVKCGFSD